MDYSKEALRLHKEWRGKFEVVSKVKLDNKDILSIAYTPGVAAPCLEIKEDITKSFDYTARGNTVAVITDGTAVLGLGDIGPEAGMPVMEGKAILFKEFGNVNAIPLCIKSKDTDEIVRTIALLSGSFGGINLEDISAPRCFEIERRLKELCDIPVFHDDQHGTAIVAGAGVLNALKLVKKDIGKVKVVLNGAGSAGIAIGKFLLSLGVKNLILVDHFGIICEGMEELNSTQAEVAKVTNRDHLRGTLADAIKGADLFLGVSAGNVVSKEMVTSMAERAIMFCMANPTPEIMPTDALAAGAYVVGTGRSDFPNQINNVLAFPGIFRGALDVRARDINDEMKIAASYAIADSIPENQLAPDYIIPGVFDESVHENVAKAVMKAARESGVARI